jgi:hypothetical protein
MNVNPARRGRDIFETGTDTSEAWESTKVSMPLSEMNWTKREDA